jgi:hypothetical protein
VPLSGPLGYTTIFLHQIKSTQALKSLSTYVQVLKNTSQKKIKVNHYKKLVTINHNQCNPIHIN